MSIWIVLLIFLILFFIGTPVSISMGVSALIYFIVEDYSLSVLISRMATGVYSYLLLSVPLFILAALVMNESGVTEKIFKFTTELVGWVPGGLGHANVLASMIFAGISGAAVADASGLGLVEMKAMKEAGYDKKFSIGITASSSMIGPIIPPSIMLIVYGHLAELSIGKLWVSGIAPGIMTGGILMLFVYYMAKTNKEIAPPPSKISFSRIIKSFKSSFFSLLLPPILILALLCGVATPTEVGLLAVLYAFFLGLFYKGKELIKAMPRVLLETIESTAVIMFLIATSYALIWVITVEKFVPQASTFFLGLTNNKYLFLFVINIFLLFVGALLDQLPALLIVVPILSPLAVQYGIDPIHFALLSTFNLMIGLITPPFGVALFIMARITNTPVRVVVKSCIKFIIPLLISLIIITYYPPLSLFLVKLIF